MAITFLPVFTYLPFQPFLNFLSFLGRKMSFIAGEEFQHIHRIQNTNIDGNVKALYAMTKIRGIGRRFSDLVLKKSEIDRTKRAGQLSNDEIERMQTTMQHFL